MCVAMASPQDSEPPEPTSPESFPSTGSGEAGVTAEQLARVVRRLEAGFYDQAEVREQIARRALDDLDQ